MMGWAETLEADPKRHIRMMRQRVKGMERDGYALAANLLKGASDQIAQGCAGTPERARVLREEAARLDHDGYAMPVVLLEQAAARIERSFPDVAQVVATTRGMDTVPDATAAADADPIAWYQDVASRMRAFLGVGKLGAARDLAGQARFITYRSLEACGFRKDLAPEVLSVYAEVKQLGDEAHRRLKERPTHT
jgi:hypothetical protein